MIAYLIKFILCSGFLYSFYKVLLERESMYKINRFYLLFALVFSLTAPLYKIDLPISKQETNISPELLAFIMQNPELFQQQEGVNFGNILTIISCFIGFILLVKFSYNLFELLFKIKTDEKIKDEEITYILDLESNQPYSFWKYIFIPKKQLYKLHQNLIDHEKAHCIQKHSLDILFIEIFQIIFWFNPFVYFYKKSIKLNHEFLADEYVLQKETDLKTYQHQILDCIATQSPSIMASNFNFILTKKRLIMMTKNTSKRKVKLLSFASLPFILSAFVLFSQKTFAQEIQKSAEKVEQTLDKTVQSQAEEFFGIPNKTSPIDTIKKVESSQNIASNNSSEDNNVENIQLYNNDKNIKGKINKDSIKYTVVSNFSKSNNKGINLETLEINDLITKDIKINLAKISPKDIKAIDVFKKGQKIIITMNDSLIYSYDVNSKKMTPIKKSDLSKLQAPNKYQIKLSSTSKTKYGEQTYIDENGVKHKVDYAKTKIINPKNSDINLTFTSPKNATFAKNFSYSYSFNDDKSIDDEIKELKQSEQDTKKQIKELEKLKKKQKSKN